MAIAPLEDGLRVVTADDDVILIEEERRMAPEPTRDADLESLRDEFVDAFNARDLDAVLAIVHEDVETPDTAGDGAADLAEELEAIWERSPDVILTRALLDDRACAVAWRPDEDGSLCRAALVCFEADAGLLTVVALPDDADALDRAEADDPVAGELDEWQDWARWDRGEETVPRPRR